MSRLPFQIKICGVTTAADALAAVEYGASAIGLNFFSQSKRLVTLEAAMEIRSKIPRNTAVAGVFVNSSVMEISTASGCDLEHETFEFFEGSKDGPIVTPAWRLLDWVQIHGDETPARIKLIKETVDLPIIRALRWGPEGRAAIDEYLQQCAALDCLPDAVLIDAHKPGEYGGTGETADWEAIARWREKRQFDISLVLAGGLTPTNVAEAIRIVRPDAVDTASGVESAPGKKDTALVKEFIDEAKKAFAVGE